MFLGRDAEICPTFSANVTKLSLYFRAKHHPNKNNDREGSKYRCNSKGWSHPSKSFMNNLNFTRFNISKNIFFFIIADSCFPNCIYLFLHGPLIKYLINKKLARSWREINILIGKQSGGIRLNFGVRDDLTLCGACYTRLGFSLQIIRISIRKAENESDNSCWLRSPQFLYRIFRKHTFFENSWKKERNILCLFWLSFFDSLADSWYRSEFVLHWRHQNLIFLCHLSPVKITILWCVKIDTISFRIWHFSVACQKFTFLWYLSKFDTFVSSGRCLTLLRYLFHFSINIENEEQWKCPVNYQILSTKYNLEKLFLAFTLMTRK